MPLWSHEPPPDDRGVALPIVRTPAIKPLQAIVTSDAVVGTITHYWQGRTTPCEQKQCEPCAAGMPWRWHGYLGAWSPASHTHCLFEFTAQACEHFTTYRATHGTLRGCLFRAFRPSKTHNGRVCIDTKPADLQRYDLPKEPDVIRALAIIWNLATSTMTVEEAAEKVTEIRLARGISADGNGRQ